MRVGIISEYNPFHNGHKYQIEQLKRKGYDEIIIFMSGNFVQRGEPSIQDKVIRAKNAINNGACLVIQVPTPLVLQSADYYADNIIKLIDSLKITDTISFGVWNQNLNTLEKTADKLIDLESDYAFNKTKSINQSIRNSNSILSGAYFRSGNNLLAVQYIKSIKKNFLNLKTLPINRLGNIDNAETVSSNTASATLIRKIIDSGEIPHKYLPECYDYSSLIDKINVYNFLSVTFMYKYYQGCDFSGICAYENGIDNFIAKKIKCGYEIDSISSKKYSNSRIKRFICCSALNITDNCLSIYRESNYPVRVLAADNIGINIIKHYKDKNRFIMNPSDYFKLPDKYSEIHQIENIATNICYNSSINHEIGFEFSNSTYYKK